MRTKTTIKKEERIGDLNLLFRSRNMLRVTQLPTWTITDNLLGMGANLKINSPVDKDIVGRKNK